MSKYIPAVKVIDKHFNSLTYEMSFGTTPRGSYQEALNDATELVLRKKAEKPIVHVDGFEYPKPRYKPVVLKEVVMQEAL